MRSRSWPCLLSLAALLAGCGGGTQPTGPTSPASPTPSPSPAAGLSNARNGIFDVAVLVGPISRTPSRAEIERVFLLAVTILAGKTGERMRLVDVAFGASGSSGFAAGEYVAAHSANPPEGVVVLADDETARTFGGYSITITPRFAFQSEFSSPRAGVGSDKVYVAVMHFDHPYARCGYDDNGNRISDVSVGGECRGRPGTPCVARGDRFMCADAVDNLYAQPDEFPASTIVHEFMHPFGIDPNAALDHYGTQPCRDRTGMTLQAAADLHQAQLNTGMCPDVFPRFRRTP